MRILITVSNIVALTLQYTAMENLTFLLNIAIWLFCMWKLSIALRNYFKRVRLFGYKKSYWVLDFILPVSIMSTLVVIVEILNRI